VSTLATSFFDMIQLHSFRDRANEECVNNTVRVSHRPLPPYFSIAELPWLPLFSPPLPQPTISLVINKNLVNYTLRKLGHVLHRARASP
jgi:hypothetical protein